MTEETQVLEALEQMIAPARDLLGKLDEEILEHEQKAQELRKKRTQVRNVLRAVDPEHSPAAKNAKRDRSGEGARASATSVEKVLTYLRRSQNGDGNSVFSAKDIPHDDIGLSYATVTVVLRQLRNDGLIRLDHVDKYSAKFYVPTAAFHEQL